MCLKNGPSPNFDFSFWASRYVVTNCNCMYMLEHLNVFAWKHYLGYSNIIYLTQAINANQSKLNEWVNYVYTFFFFFFPMLYFSNLNLHMRIFAIFLFGLIFGLTLYTYPSVSRFVVDCIELAVVKFSFV